MFLGTGSKEEMQEEDIDLKNSLFMCSRRSRREGWSYKHAPDKIVWNEARAIDCEERQSKRETIKRGEGGRGCVLPSSISLDVAIFLRYCLVFTT